MFSPVHQPLAKRCSHCWDPSTKQQSTHEYGCKYCYNTTFEGGIREIYVTCASIGVNHKDQEQISKYGSSTVDTKKCYFGAFNRITDYDYVLIPNGWESSQKDGYFKPSKDYTAYRVQSVFLPTIKDGLGWSQNLDDIVAVSTTITKERDNSIIYKFKIPSDIELAADDFQDYVYVEPDNEEFISREKKIHEKEVLADEVAEEDREEEERYQLEDWDEEVKIYV